jgi:hypothetical protein
MLWDNVRRIWHHISHFKNNEQGLLRSLSATLRFPYLKKSGSKVVFSKRLDQQKKVGMLYELGVNC